MRTGNDEHILKNGPSTKYRTRFNSHLISISAPFTVNIHKLPVVYTSIFKIKVDF